MVYLKLDFHVIPVISGRHRRGLNSIVNLIATGSPFSISALNSQFSTVNRFAISPKLINFNK